MPDRYRTLEAPESVKPVGPREDQQLTVSPRRWYYPGDHPHGACSTTCCFTYGTLILLLG